MENKGAGHPGHALSPENGVRKNHAKFTPNGTRVPDGLKNPSTLLCHRFLWWMNEPPAADTSFVSNLNMYDTCESKPRVKNGEVNWKPKEEGFLSASEAKQVWLEREVQSLRKALAKVSVPTAFHESGYWNEGFQRFEPSNPGSDPATTALAMHQCARALPGGSGDVYLRPRPEHGGSGVDAHQRALLLFLEAFGLHILAW